jgi:hypothetical protein
MTHILGEKGPKPSYIHKVKVTVTTNGLTKFLKVEDELEDKIVPVPVSLVGQSSMLEVSINQICLSFIHQKCELISVFLSKFMYVESTQTTETEEVKTVKFSIGYLQIDN